MFALGIASGNCCWLLCHSSLNVLVVLLYVSVAWISLLFRLNVQETFSLLLKLSKFTYLPPLVLKILLSPVVSKLVFFLILFHLFHFFNIRVVLVHVPFFKFFCVPDTSLNSFFVSNIVFLKLRLEFYLLLFNKFNLH